MSPLEYILLTDLADTKYTDQRDLLALETLNSSFKSKIYIHQLTT